MHAVNVCGLTVLCELWSMHKQGIHCLDYRACTNMLCELQSMHNVYMYSQQVEQIEVLKLYHARNTCHAKVAGCLSSRMFAVKSRPTLSTDPRVSSSSQMSNVELYYS